jgi:glucokinase
MDVVAGVDVGGSHVGMCIYNGTKLLGSDNIKFDPLVTSPNQLIEIIATMIRKLFSSFSNCKLCAIGVGCPGRAKNGVLVAASNFPNWKNVPIVDLLQQRFQVPAVLLNDADAAIAAEIWGDSTDIYKGVKYAAMISNMELYILLRR